jgi:hypothetical protein
MNEDKFGFKIDEVTGWWRELRYEEREFALTFIVCILLCVIKDINLVFDTTIVTK